MRILVTGAAGLIGTGVAARLAADHDIIGMDLRGGPHVSLQADCCEVDGWRKQIGPIDAVVHVAALHAPHVGHRSDQDFRRINIEATARLLDFAAAVGASHFVLTSTTSLYGHALEPTDGAVWVDENLEPRPRDIYDETKLEAERLVALAGNAMTVTSLRMSRCFPEAADVMAWYRLHRGIDRRDVAEAHALAVARKGPPASYVVSARTNFQPADGAELAIDAPSVIGRRYPGLIERAAAKGWRPPQSIDRIYDGSLAAAELAFTPRFGIESCLVGDWDPHPAR